MDCDLSTCVMNKWWTTNVGEAPSTDWRLYYLPVEVFMNTVTAGEGERPLESNQLPAWAACFIIRDVVVFVDMFRDAGMWLVRRRRTLGFLESVLIIGNEES